MAQILGHMLDEERDDFRTRLQSTLNDPEARWAPIYPEARVQERRHQEASVDRLLKDWKSERRASLQWLGQLGEAAWHNTYAHPELGNLRAGDILLSWVNHDHLHLRQITQRLYQIALKDGAPFECAYAGPW